MVNAHEVKEAAVRRILLNSIKRNDELAAEELGVSLERFQAFMSGSNADAIDILARAVDKWPVSEREFFAVRDDAPSGFVKMSAAASKSSERCIARRGERYFNYRDSAMSTVSPIRPELVEMLVTVNDADPSNPAVRWNTGHFFYQITYFVGKVNFYYEDRGNRVCVEMNTGDSSFLGRYIPHSFAKRSDEEAYILALTFAGPLYGDAQSELSTLPDSAAQRLAGNVTSKGYLPLRDLAGDASLPLDELSRLADIEPSRIEAIAAGEVDMTDGERLKIASALRVSPIELLPREVMPPDSQVLHAGSNRTWRIGSNLTVKELAGSLTTPFARALEFSVGGDKEQRSDIETRLHQFFYNIGHTSVEVEIASEDANTTVVLEPHASLYVKPYVRVAFQATEGPGSGSNKGKLLALRVAGNLYGTTNIEALGCGEAALTRLRKDAALWY
ncbi:hypothetical protein [Rhizobium multihospitium]|uniref:Methylphosphonate synthase n=1 Tax=Rhizobium multihospitium TaxID=410764 RepID=A0A1C3XBA7_9HYPH|nr:hypothetical protein [Rhizobium multihospitium]SCB49518.1 methylphosphonate synthase [Rhizobium multihospitium]